MSETRKLAAIAAMPLSGLGIRKGARAARLWLGVQMIS